MKPSNLEVIAELSRDEVDYPVGDDGLMQNLARAESEHFWFRVRQTVVTRGLKRSGVARGAKILDLGCGTGGLTAALAAAGFCVSAIEGHRGLAEVTARRRSDLEVFVADLRAGLDFLNGRMFDVISFFDVIEHVEQDAALIHSGMGALSPGGLVVGTVPALPLLWSPVDELAGHKRRYLLSDLESLLTGLGLKIIELRYFNSLLVLPSRFRRRSSQDSISARELQEADLRVPGPALNLGLAFLLTLEDMLRVGALRRLPGASLWFVARTAASGEP